MCSHTSVLIVFALVAAGAIVSAAHADVLLEQPPDPGIHAGISSALDYYGKSPGRRTVDDFVLKAGGRVNEIAWWGQHAPPSSGHDDFSVTFFADAGGVPGKPLLKARGKVSSVPHATIPALTEYRIVLCTYLSAGAGERYWLSIFNEGTGSAWRWNNSIAGNNASVQSFDPAGGGWKRASGTKTDLSYRLGAVSISIWDWIRCNLYFLAIGAVAIALVWLFIWKRRGTGT